MTELRNHFQNIYILINPGAGQGDTTGMIASALASCQGHWTMTAISEGQSIAELVQHGLSNGADLVVACGGDGTVAAVANALMGTDVAMAIVPAGTANVFSVELGIPSAIPDAVAVFAGEQVAVRAVDVGVHNDTPFLLRMGLGWEAEITMLAPEMGKKRFGSLAYLLAAINTRRQQKRVRYTVTVDGQTHQTYGITCMISNSGNLGLPDVRVAQSIDVSDGILDVVVVQRATWPALLSVLGRALLALTPFYKTDQGVRRHINHWRGREIAVDATPHAPIVLDGEALEPDYPVRVRVRPSALKMVVPLERAPDAQAALDAAHAAQPGAAS